MNGNELKRLHKTGRAIQPQPYTKYMLFNELKFWPHGVMPGITHAQIDTLNGYQVSILAMDKDSTFKRNMLPAHVGPDHYELVVFSPDGEMSDGSPYNLIDEKRVMEIIRMVADYPIEKEPKNGNV